MINCPRPKEKKHNLCLYKTVYYKAMSRKIHITFFLWFKRIGCLTKNMKSIDFFNFKNKSIVKNLKTSLFHKTEGKKEQVRLRLRLEAKVGQLCGIWFLTYWHLFLWRTDVPFGHFRKFCWDIESVQWWNILKILQYFLTQLMKVIWCKKCLWLFYCSVQNMLTIF